MLLGVQRERLENGLTVLLKSDHRVPLACVFTWANVGYFNEPDDQLGISHFIEHMFFKGTPSRPVGAIAQETKALGGYLNAATIYDYTYYYTVVPAQNVVAALDIQADALMHPLFDAGEMEREKEVIIQELKRKYDNPDPYAWEKLLELAFDRHRIRRWRMGREEHIRGYSREAVQDYYRRYYCPANLTLAVVGDFDVETILPEIERRYGSLSATAFHHDESEPESPQTGARLARLTGDISRSLIKLGFHAPPVTHDDHYPMTFLTTLLGRGRSSRLYRALKEEKQAVDGISCSFYSSRDVGYFTIEAELKPEKIATAEEEILVEVDRLRRDPPSLEEIDKVRNIVEANFFAEKEDVMGQAYSLAYFESLGGYEKMADYVQRMRSVTPQDLVAVVDRYFKFSHLSLMEYVPERVGPGAESTARLESLHKRVLQRVEHAGPVVPPPKASPAAPMIFMPGAGGSRVEVEIIRLSETVTLLYGASKALPLASLAVYFPGGRLDEISSNCGITNFALRTALKGTENRTADEIAFAAESLGSTLRCEATADLFGYAMSMLSRNLESGIDLLSDVILRPTFPDGEIEKEKISVLASLRRTRDDMFARPIELFYEALYGLHPYGLSRNGTEESIGQLQRSQLSEWYLQIHKWRKMVVAVFGDVERERAIDLVGKFLAVSGDATEEPRAQIFPVIPDRGAREKVEERERKQTGVVMGFPGGSFRDDRYFSLEVLRNVLSGMGGRLFLELRERLGMVYTVAAFNIALLRGGAFFTYFATDPTREAEARDRLSRELRKSARERATEDEVRAAKAYAKGSYAIGHQSLQALAYEYLHQHLIGEGIDAVADYDRRIEGVTIEQVRATADATFDLDRCAQGIVRGVG